MEQFIPVNPLLQNGEFVSLMNYTDKPVKPNPFEGADPGRSEFGREYKLSYSASSKLEIAAIGSVDAKLGATTFVHDSVIYRLSKAPIVDGSPLVTSTWWGYGIRLTVTVKNSQLGVNIGWGTLAASVQLGYADAEFEIESIGINDPTLFGLLPSPIDLSIDTFDEILKVGDAFRQLAHDTDPAGIVYQPLRIGVTGNTLGVDPLADDKHLLFTYLQVSDRQRLVNAKQKAIANNLDPAVIAGFYKSVFNITDENEKPSKDVRDTASDWLNV